MKVKLETTLEQKDTLFLLLILFGEQGKNETRTYGLNLYTFYFIFYYYYFLPKIEIDFFRYYY